MKNETIINDSSVSFRVGDTWIDYYIFDGRVELEKIGGTWCRKLAPENHKIYTDMCKKHYEELKKTLQADNICLAN